MSTDERPFKVTWSRPATGTTPDLDLKRPGRIAPETRKVLLRGAVPGPPARPGPRHRRGFRA